MDNGGPIPYNYHEFTVLICSVICRPNIAIFFTILAVAVSFAWLGVEDPSKWQAGVALYILGCA